MKNPNKTYVNWGGRRENCGRPKKDYKKIALTISMEAYEIYKEQPNKGAFVSNLIIESTKS